MNIEITNKKKINIFTNIFKNLTVFGEEFNLRFDTDGFYMQGMDDGHISLFEIKLHSSWFDSYSIEKDNIIIGVKIDILAKIFNIINDQTLTLKIDNDEDILNIYLKGKKGYSQNDYGPGNIMYKINGNKYQWYIIDYGNICHKKFPISELDKDIRGRPHYCLDLYQFVGPSGNCIDPSFSKYRRKHNIKLHVEQAVKNIKKESEYKQIIKYLPKTIKNKKLLNQFILRITQIIYPNIFLKCLNTPEKVYKKYKSKQLYPELVAYCLKHHADKTYTRILNKIKQEINFIQQ